MMRKSNAAILYTADEFHTAKTRIMGRHSANEGFLSAYAKYATIDVAYSYVINENQHKAFAQQYQQQGGQAQKIVGIPFSQPQGLLKAGCLYIADPNLAEHAFTRRSIPQPGSDYLYSLCGVTHTISSEGAMQLIRNLLLSPVKPWDALICTSKAVKSAVDNIVAVNASFYMELFQKEKVELKCLLPVIPLGVHTQEFAVGAKRDQLRSRWRSQLNIQLDEVVFLFFGRLSFHAKANPFPMFKALEMAAQKTGKKLHLLQVGQFANAGIEKSFLEARQVLCPSVQCHYLDGGDSIIRQEIWYAADVFTSLVDNIQESFGLTPLEAMAAGLPVVVTDWNGYRDTVEHGKQGFLVPTIMPAPNAAGIEMAERFYRHVDNYDHYIANVANATGVDIDAAAKYYIQLVESQALRFQMGKMGRQSVVQRFDWKHIILSYQELWAELNEIRQSEQVVSRSINYVVPANPYAIDPFLIFNAYPTHAWQVDVTVLSIGDQQCAGKLHSYLTLGILDSGLKEPLSLYQRIVDFVRQKKTCYVQALLLAMSPTLKANTLWAIGRLLKIGILVVCDSNMPVE